MIWCVCVLNWCVYRSNCGSAGVRKPCNAPWSGKQRLWTVAKRLSTVVNGCEGRDDTRCWRGERTMHESPGRTCSSTSCSTRSTCSSTTSTATTVVLQGLLYEIAKSAQAPPCVVASGGWPVTHSDRTFAFRLDGNDQSIVRTKHL